MATENKASIRIPNYTAEQTATVVELYTAGTPVEVIAAEVGKSVRSIVAKLSREKVYVAKTTTKAEAKATKTDLVAKIAASFGVEASTFKSLEKATKEVLEVLAG